MSYSVLNTRSPANRFSSIASECCSSAYAARGQTAYRIGWFFPYLPLSASTLEKGFTSAYGFFFVSFCFGKLYLRGGTYSMWWRIWCFYFYLSTVITRCLLETRHPDTVGRGNKANSLGIPSAARCVLKSLLLLLLFIALNVQG